MHTRHAGRLEGILTNTSLAPDAYVSGLATLVGAFYLARDKRVVLS